MNINESNLNVAWSEIDGEGLVRVVRTGSFRRSIELVAQLAAIADEQNHEPELLLQPGKVTITLYSPDTQEVGERDVRFAQAVDQLLG